MFVQHFGSVENLKNGVQFSPKSKGHGGLPAPGVHRAWQVRGRCAWGSARRKCREGRKCVVHYLSMFYTIVFL